MEAFLTSTAAVAIGEVGDKTQLLALMLAARFRKPVPIVLGILVATLFNHAMAGAVGAWVTTLIGPQALRWVVGVSFIAMAVWMLIPDKIDEDEVKLPTGLGAFGATAVAFFLAEMGDKTQLATVALAARYHDLIQVVAGTTLGMLIADVPAVFVGDRMGQRIPVKLVHGVAAVLFAVLGVLALLNVGHVFG
jgi:putative Ca2+/H+ antiporter (TMEM165/GDT1 family)